jgi:ketosteroid isomerase-like protein
LLAGCVSAPAPSCGDAASAGAVLGDIIAADNARDIERAMSFYTEDVVWAPPAPRPEMRGARAVRESYERMYSAFNPRLEAAVETAVANGASAVVTGRTSGTLVPQMTDAASVQVNDHFEARLRCVGGHWRVSRLAWRPAT